MAKPTIKDYEEASGLDFSIKGIRKAFQEQLYSHGIPETQVKIIAAKENQEYLGQYRNNSQFRGGVAFQVHIGNHFPVAEEMFLKDEKEFYDNNDISLDNLNNSQKAQIAQTAMKGLMQTLWHEYGHAIYEYFKVEDNENTHFKEAKKFFGADEEEFVEQFARLYAGTNHEEVTKLASYPLAVEESIITNTVHQFVIHNFFPEDIENCKEINKRQEFIKVNFLKGFPEEGKYNIEGKYDLKVHQAYLKNEVRIIQELFDNPLEIVHIQTPERGKYPLIKIGNKEGNQENIIFIDSVNPKSLLNQEKNTYSFEEIQDKLIEVKKNKPL